MKIGIKGIGVLGGFGCGVSELERALVAGKSPGGKTAMRTSGGILEVPAFTANTDRLKEFVDKGALRRSDHYIRLALLGAYLALEDAGMAADRPKPMGIIVATGYGATCNTFDIQNSILEEEAPACSPIKFSNSVHNAAAGHIAISLGEMGPNLSISHHDMSMPSALLAAWHWLREERVEAVLVGGVDEYCKVLGYDRYSRRRDRVENSSADPSEGIIGEGACFFVLTRRDAASPYGFIEDVRMGNYRRGDPDLPKGAAFFLGADGLDEYDRDYGDCLPESAQAAIYTDLIGAIPIGNGFDIAIAALSCKAGRIRASTGGARCHADRLHLIRRTQPLGQDGICCLKLGAGHTFGWVQLKGF